VDIIEGHYGPHGCPDETLNRRIYRDPLVGGIAIGNSALAEFGTLGCFLTDEQDATYLLCCQHVLVAGGEPASDVIIQPARGQIVTPDRTPRIATVTRGVLDRRMDAAIAQLTTGRKVRNDLMPIGAPTGVLDPIPRSCLPLAVTKVGACTGVSDGFVDSIDFSVRVEYPQGVVRLENQIHIVAEEPGGEFSREGDSGAVVVERETRRVVGLLCAGEMSGEAEYGVASPIGPILREFKVSLRLAGARRADG
jgi:hypothetical protein